MVGFVEIARVMLLALRPMKLFSYYHCILRRLYCVHLLYFLKICFYICMYTRMYARCYTIVCTKRVYSIDILYILQRSLV